MNSEVLAHQQAGAAERMRRMRAKQKETFTPQVVLDTSAFSTVQLKEKLMKKVFKALPTNVDQRRELLLTVYNKTAFEEKLVQLPKSKHNLNLSRNTASKVINFFCNDETTRVSPNVKDFVTSYRDENKLKLQVRYMQFTVKEAYQEFKKQNPGNQIGFSKFAELKPSHVRSLTKIAHNVCCCLIQENMRMALESQKKNKNQFYFPIFMLETVCRKILFVSRRQICASLMNAKSARASNYFQNLPNNWNLLKKV